MPFGSERADQKNSGEWIGYWVQNRIEVRARNRKISGLLRQVSFWGKLSLHLKGLLHKIRLGACRID